MEIPVPFTCYGSQVNRQYKTPLPGRDAFPIFTFAACKNALFHKMTLTRFPHIFSEIAKIRN
jgi:hypothetical protein